MRAKNVNETSSILKPKSAEELYSSMKLDPKFKLQFELMNSCMKYWESKGIKFNKAYYIDDMIRWLEKNGYYTSKFNNWKTEGINQVIPLFAFPYSYAKFGALINSLQGVLITKTGKISTQKREFAHEPIDINDFLSKIKTHDVPKLLR